MPYRADHKQQSREKILQSAIDLFSRHGYEKTGIDAIMQKAEMTRGAFYAHFSSKSELYQKAMLSSALQSPLSDPNLDSHADQEWLNLFVSHYLSHAHIEQKRPPCPMAFLVTDVAVNEPRVRRTYTAIFRRMNSTLQRVARRFRRKNTEADVYAALATMIGAVAIGRCLDQRPVRDRMLIACQKLAIGLLNGDIHAR